jgi:pyruvate dehydrogenase E1 component alpha subunit
LAEITESAYGREELSEEQLREFYGLMVLTRTFDAQAVNLQRQGRIGFFVPCEGEEAAEIGSIMALSPEDWILPDYRASGTMIGRGMPLESMLAQLMANSEDHLKGRSMPSHWGSRDLKVVAPSSPLCTQLPHAVGVGLAAKMKGDGICAIAYFGDGGTSSNDFHSAMNFAAVFKTPTVFFCRNNGYAISVPLSKQTATLSLVVKASAYAMEGVQVDGNDILAVYSATKRAVEKARAGGGPTFIEAVTYRMGPHSTSDDPTKYRADAEVEQMRANDPIARFREHLSERGIWTEEDESKLRRVTMERVKEAIARAEKVPKPEISTIFEDVYAELSPTLEKEAADLQEETRSER